jgi:uncharacterized membrane protein YfcA
MNLFKLPFSMALGLTDETTVFFAVALAPAVAIGLAAGRGLVHHIPQRLFNALLLAFTVITALRLIGLF